MQSILNLGIDFIVGLQSVGKWPTLPMEAFSFLGTEVFYVITLPLLYWCVDSAIGLRVAVNLMISGALNNALKLTCQGPRPYWISTHVEALGAEPSFGVPSGHAQNAVAFWGMLAVGLRKGWGWATALLVVLFIGLSRLYLAVHFPHDILMGWLIGALLLWLTVRWWDPVATWARQQPLGRQVLAAGLGSLPLVLVAAVPFLWLRLTGWQAPPEWAAYAGRAVSFERALVSAGMLCGLLAGAAWCHHRQDCFTAQGTWWQLLLRYFLGMAGLLALRFGLKLIFPAGETIAALALRFLGYALIGAWVTAGAPHLFHHLKLAEKSA